MATADPKKKKKKRKKKESLEHKRNRILVALGIFAVVYALDELGALTAAFGTPGDIYASFALFLVPFLIAGYDVLQKAFNNIRRGKAFDESFLMAVATIGAFAMVLFPDTDPHMAEGAAVMLFYQVGELFQAYAVGKSRKSISAMMDIAPDYANVEQPDGTLEQVFPDDIAVGTVIVVKPGERVPIDGVIVEGETQLDTAALTGESVPRPAKTGDDIISGCINMTGLIHVRTTKPFGESTVARVLELVENASEKKARTENFITRFARVYTPAVTGAAAVLALGGGLVTGAWSDWILRGLTFLVVSCPCALGLATPVAIMVGSGVGAKNGVLFKTAASLEETGRIQIVALDKTGTVTSGEPTVTDICPVPGVTEAELLGAACALEQKSEHPLAKAVLRRAQADGLTAAEVTAFQALPGSGLQAMLDGQKLCGGNADFIRTAAALPDVVSVRAEQLAEEGKTPLFFARGGKLLGVIAVADVLKPDSPQAIRALQNMGIRVVMLTGDNARTAKAIGAQAGVDEVIAGVLPDGKEREIRRLSARGKVAMVGDGINDAPALTRADVGIAIGAGTDVAIDAADVVLVNSRLSDVPAAIRLSRATLRNIRENLFWAFFYNTIGIPIAAGVFVPLGLTLSPMLGAAAMSLSSFCVVTNALRLNLFDLHDARRDHKRASHLKEVPEIKEETTMKKTISIEGMMCTHCEATVKKALEALPEVTEAVVSHTAGTAVVTLSAPVDDAALKAAVEAKDYTVTGIA